MANAVISEATIDTLEIVAGVAGKTIRVKGMLFSGLTGQTVVFKNATTAVTGVMTVASGVPVQMAPSNRSWFECAAGAALNMTLTAATQVSGVVIYEQS